jgi:hypothetical protein
MAGEVDEVMNNEDYSYVVLCKFLSHGKTQTSGSACNDGRFLRKFNFHSVESFTNYG